MNKLKVGIAGYGIVGQRRHFFLKEHPQIEVIGICDQIFKEDYLQNGEISYYRNIEELLKLNLNILFVCLTNNVAAKVTITALNKGFHVFCEKPPGMDVGDIEDVIRAEKMNSELKLKYGFNHRYHESIKKALKIIQSGELGKIINLRGVYGKSKVIPFSGGWRSKRELAGGGILLDQGIHMLDLMRLICGEFVEVKSYVSNNYWKHDVEDNAYALLKDEFGRIAMLNSSATQWQHKFSLDISLTEGYIELSGILSGSKSYGEEKIKFGKREKESNNGQMESKTFKYLEDNSWRDEIYEFIDAIINDAKIESGSSSDALETMKLVYSIYFEDEDWRARYNIEKP